MDKKNEKEKVREKKFSFDNLKKKLYFSELENVLEEPKEKLVGFKLWQVIVIILIVSITTTISTYFVTKGLLQEEKETIDYILNTMNQDFSTAYNSILNTYYKELDEDELFNQAIYGMIESLGDEYAEYYPPVEKEEFDDAIEGRLTGIGVSITTNLYYQVVITNVFDDSPAKEAGLQVGDIFTAVENESVDGLYASQISGLITGEEGTFVNVSVLRNDEELSLDVERREIVAPSVTSMILEENDKKIAYIDIDRFSSDTGQVFYEHLTSLETEGFDALIIDVRSNTGGYLSSVTEIASNFVPLDSIIYQLQQKDSIENIISKNTESIDYEIAVLQNSMSASASEILSVALKETVDAYIVGTNSYGKGTAQKTTLLNNGGMIKFTVQNWLSPNGNIIDKVGVSATIEVEVDDEYLIMPIMDNDNQLKAAIEVLTN